ncbi:hypothetical protein [Cupriavidus necator]|uniref:hypothetical protein n=1 Tax=Cupriavidus necator TaxID=106590 RepID=UPI00339D8E6E
MQERKTHGQLVSEVLGEKAGHARAAYFLLLRPSQIKATAEEAALMIPAAAKFRDLYSGLDVPVTLIAGAGDKIIDVESHSARLHRAAREQVDGHARSGSYGPLRGAR